MTSIRNRTPVEGIMSDQDAVYAECRAAQSEDREISDGCARTIATWYHDPSPGGQAGSAFSHTGAIADPTDDTYRSLVSSPSLYTDATADDRLALDMLGTYLLNAGPRGPVDGWDNVWVETNGGHADYPHEIGTLYDCAQCEAECYCLRLGDTSFQCVHCALVDTGEVDCTEGHTEHATED